MRFDRVAECAVAGRGRGALLPLACLAPVAVLWFLLPHPAVAVVAGLLPVAAFVVLRYPLLPIIGFIVFSFFRIHDIFRPLEPFKLPQLLALASLGTLAWHMVLTQRIRPFVSRELALFLGLFLAVSAGIPFSRNMPHSIEVWSATYSKIALMTFAIAWLIKTPAHFAITLRVFVLAGMVVAWKALANQAAGVGLVEGTRVTVGIEYGSPLGDPNDLSLALLFPLAFALSLGVGRRTGRVWRLIGLAAAAMIVLAILATQSRGGLLGTVAVFAALAQRYVRSKALLAAGGTLALVVLFVAASVGERSSGGSGDGVDASAMGRLHAWQAGFSMALANPLTGVGIGNFVGQYFYYTPVWDGLHHAAHSTWFEMMGDAGFLAFALLVALTVTSLRSAYGQLARLEACDSELALMGRALACGLVGFVVSGTFLSQAFTWPLYIQMALVVALSRVPVADREIADAAR